MKKKLHLYWANYKFVINARWFVLERILSTLYFISHFVTKFAKTYEFEDGDKKSSPHFDVNFVIFKERAFFIELVFIL